MVVRVVCAALCCIVLVGCEQQATGSKTGKSVARPAPAATPSTPDSANSSNSSSAPAAPPKPYDALSLTVESLKATPDDQIMFQIWLCCRSRLQGDGPEAERAMLAGLPAALRRVYAVNRVAPELGDGFFDYFFDMEGRLADEALAGFRMIGATGHAGLLERALDIYKVENPQMAAARAKKSEAAAEAAYDELRKKSGLNALDEEYGKLTEDLHAMIIAHLRAHTAEYETD